MLWFKDRSNLLCWSEVLHDLMRSWIPSRIYPEDPLSQLKKEFFEEEFFDYRATDIYPKAKVIFSLHDIKHNLQLVGTLVG